MRRLRRSAFQLYCSGLFTLTPLHLIKMKQIMARLDPLRSGAPLITPQELAQVDDDWVKWRAEWVHRKKVFNECVLPGSIFVPLPAGFLAGLFLWTLLAHRVVVAVCFDSDNKIVVAVLSLLLLCRHRLYLSIRPAHLISRPKA
jgi:hypothetical protein